MKKIKTIIFLIILLTFSCKQKEQKDLDKNQSQIDSINLNEKIHKSELSLFLENPIDLINYKKGKTDWTSSGGTSGFLYYFNPQKENGMYYNYYYPNDNSSPINFDNLVVYKIDKNKYYNDNSDRLIEMNIFSKDSILKKADLVGLKTSQIETKYGKENFRIDNDFIFFIENKLLILTIKNDEIDSYKYLRLNTDKIDKELIKKIKN